MCERGERKKREGGRRNLRHEMKIEPEARLAQLWITKMIKGSKLGSLVDNSLPNLRLRSSNLTFFWALASVLSGTLCCTKESFFAGYPL